ncbi:30S ribosomal protein S13 [ANME-2 cluster archaeon]|nr:30S ribosomal protein S13 [Methanosarcinales archaeon]RJS68155.1 MAG: 30S ribosomal protein S13 [ANME-2 cluster archaeon]
MTDIEETPEIRHLVRIANTDLDGHKSVQYALTGLKGIGIRTAKILADSARVDPTATIGSLEDVKIEKLKQAIEKFNNIIPSWMLNRRRDLITGEDKHIIGVDLVLAVDEDINIMKKTRSYTGIRHERGLRVRGQRTRSTGRTGATVGVSRKRVKQ